MVTLRQFKSCIVTLIAILGFVVYGINPITVTVAVVAIGVFVWASHKDYMEYKADLSRI